MPYNFDEKFNNYLGLFENGLNNFINSLEEQNSSTLKEAVSYSILGGGKRLRPILALATAEILGVDFDKVLPLCIALELIQSYSLVHDDLPAMDNDDYRRGKLSTHKKFGEAMGILAGDAMLNLAFESALNSSHIDQNYLEALRLVFCYSGYNGMVYGQVLDLENEKNSNLNEKTLRDIYINKTVKMFKAPLVAVSLIASKKHFDELNEYGECLGLAFQIQDDILDVEGSFETIGKTPNKDQNCDKFTSIKVLGIDGAKNLVKKLFENAINAIKRIDNNQFLIDFAKKLNKRKY